MFTDDEDDRTLTVLIDDEESVLEFDEVNNEQVCYSVVFTKEKINSTYESIWKSTLFILILIYP